MSFPNHLSWSVFHYSVCSPKLNFYSYFFGSVRCRLFLHLIASNKHLNLLLIRLFTTLNLPPTSYCMTFYGQKHSTVFSFFVHPEQRKYFRFGGARSNIFAQSLLANPSIRCHFYRHNKDVLFSSDYGDFFGQNGILRFCEAPPLRRQTAA